MGKIILASSSPRRASILKTMKLDFDVIPSEYDEPHTQTVFSCEFVEKLAYNKAFDVAQKLHSQNKNFLVLGADTIVVIDNKILGKPNDYQDAFATLKMLSGKTHFVVTSVAIINSNNLEFTIKSDKTYVTLENLTDEQIRFYLDNFKPFDKAGSYGIQELPDGYVKSVDGQIDNVIGLPSKLVSELLAEMQ
ncbi:septum formation protein Maf [bacterium]|nr:septum formation protein Maf [bacterium]